MAAKLAETMVALKAACSVDKSAGCSVALLVTWRAVLTAALSAADWGDGTAKQMADWSAPYSAGWKAGRSAVRWVCVTVVSSAGH